ncbi:hypothetical protein NPIL_78311 [Nephila pilipes]|uniref:Uncharacterized protein n=1 Tax=Nephila pilipes TaxID=299642 RepID=A0A8X6Q6U4_NEPPI|nr:hypothetical protein NPIL_78311 [Nephila pilipes]
MLRKHQQEIFLNTEHFLEMRRLIDDGEKKINIFKATEEIHKSLSFAFEECKRIKDSFQDTEHKLFRNELFDDLLIKKEELDMMMGTTQSCLTDVWIQINDLKNFLSVPMMYYADISIIFETMYFRKVEKNILTLASMTHIIEDKCFFIIKIITNIDKKIGQGILHFLLF